MNEHPEEVPIYIVGYGFGASFVALFAQLGGGIHALDKPLAFVWRAI